ncbi:protein TIPIN homolog [Anopheles darlingi]|uniref:protein TIPIN homolog n=1 Tax=Anopheles darlingi TaxID=43151 RepID=UPI0021002B0C|nr:protein TIPIN homolog [Anopheles darlingi]
MSENEGEILSDDDIRYDDDPEEGENGGDNDGPTGGPTQVKVEHKKKVVTNPRFTLNATRLCGPRGIIAMRDHFQGFKFRGKGQEVADLDEILRRMEHWAHRLFPKYHLDDVIATAERLGTKKEVQSYMDRYRRGELQRELAEGRDDGLLSSDSDDGVADQAYDGRNRLNQPLDPLDSMLDEQIALSRGRTSMANTSGVGNLDSTFDEVARREPSKEPSVAPAPKPAAVLSEEVRAKIEANRLRALELRKARMNAQHSEEKENEVRNTEIDTTF